MKIIIVGHRGVGKTSFLERCKTYLKNKRCKFVDLDQEIEKATQMTTAQIFSEKGEKAFRQLEEMLFKKIFASFDHLILSVGGGLDVSLIPQRVRVIWLQRASDLSGRIFVDRPRLEENMQALEEFHKRASERNIKFLNCMSEQYQIPEGLEEVHEVEQKMVLNDYQNLGGILTLQSLYTDASRWLNFEKRYLNSGMDFLELRTDLLTEKQISMVLEKWPKDKVLLSHRRKIIASTDIAWQDWALEDGPPTQDYAIVSLHERESSLEKTLQKLTEYKSSHLKLATEIENFTELRKVLDWQKEDPKNRSVLPRSKQGRWYWMRLLLKEKQKLNFWREGLIGSSLDQPTLFWWLNFKNSKEFAAVLGTPVEHSFTPMFHDQFFSQQNENVFSIDIQAGEWDEALPLLRELGLHQAAITSPHKEKAFKAIEDVSETAKKWQSVNTLFLGKKIQGHNTDGVGFTQLLEPYKNTSQVAVWGGGGTLEMLKAHLPQAVFYSARTGLKRGGPLNQRPEMIVWAAGNNTHLKIVPEAWQPQVILDLSYREDSLGRELAQIKKCRYVSGLEMFKAQALEQQKWWESFRT